MFLERQIQMSKRYLEIASQRNVLLGCVAVSAALMYLMSENMFPPSAIKPFMDATTAEKALSAAAEGQLLKAYAISLLTLDTLFPIAYVALLSGLIFRSQSGRDRVWLALTPVVLGMWDYCENTQLALIHFLYPDHSAWLIDSALLFGKGKFLGLAVCMIIWLASWISGRFRKADG
jgi:hypothetical protein